MKQEQNKVLYDTVRGYEPKKVDDQYCYVKIEIKQIGDDIIKQEILECADGRRGINTPGYWDLFAQFYYRDVSAPEYCRFYSRQITSLNRSERRALTRTVNGRYNNG